METRDWIALAQAVSTFLVVFVALFGDWLTAKHLFPVSLSLSVLDPLGEAISVTFGPPPVSAPARYYHVLVRNPKRYPKAQDVRLMLVRLEQEGPDGRPHDTWTGGVPLVWQPGETYGTPANPVGRVVGRDAVADLCRVVRGQGLSLVLPLIPHNLQATYPKPAHIFVTLVARADEGDSPPLRIEIAWDGLWADGSDEMARHLVLRVP